MEHLKYPIGKYVASKEHTPEQLAHYLNELRTFPEHLKANVRDLTEEDLAKTYREGSWTVKQVVHHIGESHMNAYIRIKLALTEDNPTIKPYDEDLWVRTRENEILDPAVSLALIESLHAKMVALLENLTEQELTRTFFHPQYQRTSSIADLMALYSWHGRHHIGHIKLA